MKILRKLFVAATLLPTVAGAATINYEGALTVGSTVTGSISELSTKYSVDSNLVDYWYLDATYGVQYFVTGSRLDAGYDMSMWLFKGEFTDDSVFTGGFETGFDSADPSFVDFADDNIDFVGGPFGDPVLTFVADSTDTYTVIVVERGFSNPALSGGDGWDYSVTTTVAPVPLPAALPMLGASLIGLVGLRRRAQRCRVMA